MFIDQRRKMLGGLRVMEELSKKDYGDLPFVECVEMAEDLVRKGFVVYQKFTCGKCGQRLAMNKANSFYTSGTCDKCGYETKIDKCGFILLAVFGL